MKGSKHRHWKNLSGAATAITYPGILRVTRHEGKVTGRKVGDWR